MTNWRARMAGDMNTPPGIRDALRSLAPSPEDKLAAKIREHLTNTNGRAPMQVKTDAPLSLTGQ